MGMRDSRKSEEIILTDGHPRGLHMKRRRTMNRYTFIMLEHLLISCPRGSRVPFVFFEETGSRQYFRLPRSKKKVMKRLFLKKRVTFPTKRQIARNNMPTHTSRLKIRFEMTSNNFFSAFFSHLILRGHSEPFVYLQILKSNLQNEPLNDS